MLKFIDMKTQKALVTYSDNQGTEEIKATIDLLEYENNTTVKCIETK